MAASMRKEKVAVGEKFLNFLKILHENFSNLRNFCEKHKDPKSEGIAEFAERALEKLLALEVTVQKLQQTDEKVDIELLQTCIQSYAKILLDVTYCEEASLVDGVFPEKTSKARVHRLLCMLGQPELVCQHCFPDIPVREMMSEEIVECMLWRRGALLYMYCHTIHEQEDRRKREHADFLWGCEHGALYLQKMMQVRQGLKESREELECHDEFTYQLLSKGIYSDTHVLSLIYAGEMCYWYLSSKNENLVISGQNPSLSSPSSSDNSTASANVSPSPPKSQAELEKLEKIQARKKVEARRKNKKGRGQPLKDRCNSMDDLLLPGLMGDSSLVPEASPPPSEAEKRPFDAWSVGVSMVQLYMEVAQGMNGWGREQANHLFGFFNLLQADSQTATIVQSSDPEATQPVIPEGGTDDQTLD